MKTFMVSAAIMAAMGASVPLAAQPSYDSGQRYEDQRDRGWNSSEFWRGAPNNTWERISFLQQRIDRGVRDGSLDRREARRASAQLRDIRQDAQQMRRHRGGYGASQEAALQSRLDDLSRNLRWMRSNGNVRDARYYDRYRTDYDASRYYRQGSYQERYLTSNDEIYRGSDGRYYCKRNDGTTGLVVGAAAGGILGAIATDGLAGPLIGGAVGALVGRSIDKNSDVRCR
jgi:hypothetical protein